MTRQRISGPPPCQVGTLAQLRRVAAEHVGQLMLVQGVADWPTGIGQYGQPCRGWQVVVLRREIEIDGRTYRDVVVAEPCLQALCQLPQILPEETATTQLQLDFYGLLDQAKRALAADHMTPTELDAALEGAAAEATQPHRPPFVPILWP